MKALILQVKIIVAAKSIVVWDKTKMLGRALKREAHETKHASGILLRMLQRKQVSPEEIKYLKEQTTDIGKAIAVLGMKVIPGSILAIIAIEKVGQKNGFTIFPKEQIKPGSANADTSQQAETENKDNTGKAEE